MKEFHLIRESYEDIFPKITAEINTKNTESYIFHYESDFANSKIIRDFVGAIFDSLHIPALWRGRFILITDELINNSIEHGSREGDINQCIITTQIENNTLFRISLEVHDTGKWASKALPQNIEKPKNATDETPENMPVEPKKDDVYMGKRGRGLFHITEKIVDTLTFWQSDKGGLMVKIEKCIDTTEEDCRQKSENISEKISENSSENSSGNEKTK